MENEIQEFEENLRKSVVSISKHVDDIFFTCTPESLGALNITELVEASYVLGHLTGSLEEKKIFENNPDYAKTLSRLGVVKSRLCERAEEKDRGFE